MGIKRCPSFSKRPGFPCGLRVLLLDCNEAQRQDCEQRLKECNYEVTQCSTTAEALSRLAGSCSFDVLLADKPSIGGSSDLECLLKGAESLPCVFMASNPSSEDVMAGVKLGAVDFLSKPLAPLKLRNIWQHTVRKMMCNMNINCTDSAATAAVDELALAAACTGKPRVSMEVILEETEDDLAAAAARASLDASGAAAGKPPAPPSPSGNSGGSGGSVINYSNGPNMALAITSSFYEPSKASGSMSLSRCGSSAMTYGSFDAPSGSGSVGPDSPVMDRPAKQQHGHHGPVRSCPSTRSLNSAASCYSSWASFAVHASPSSDGLQKQGAEAAGSESYSMVDDLCASRAAQRCMKKAVRHPPAATAAAGAACKPPLAAKPAPAQQQKPAAGSPAPSAGKPMLSSGLASIPLPTGLGALPQGMVWGMPMCPLVRAPGIVPPANPSTGAPCAGQAAGMPTMPMAAPWGMCGLPMFGAIPPPPFMAGGYGSMMGIGFSGAPAAAAGFGMPAGTFMDPYGQHQIGDYPQQQQMWGQLAEQQQGAAASKGAAARAAPTGAAVAAALDASFSAAALLGSESAGTANAAAAAVAMDDDAFDFILGDIAAEDDITDVCGGLLDADMSVLACGTIKMPAELSSEMQALEADLQQQAAAAAAAAAGRCSFESSAMQRQCSQRVSFDCSTASTCTAARASFEASQRCNSARVSFEVSCHNSKRVSFEVHSHNSNKPAAAGPVSGSPVNLKTAASAPTELLGSVSDLFAACSGDSSHASGLQHVDSCGMLADLQSFFAASEDSSCPQHCADSALTDSNGLFLDPLDDMPIDMGMCKNDSFSELINASLPGLAN